MAKPMLTPDEMRLKALRRFAISITVLNIFGHTVLGFETSVLQVLVSVATTYSIELLLQAIDDWSHGRRPAFMGKGIGGLIDFLLPAHITGFAISMLLFAHDELLPYIMACAVAITSKAIFTVLVRGKPRHFMNPSNVGLTASIVIYERIGLAAPYEFTEHLYGLWYVFLPCFILYTGSLLNGKLTRRMPLILAWTAAFIGQAIVRHYLFDTRLIASLVPVTGVPFVIFSFYMVTDPATSPSSTRSQIIFGVSLAAIYGILMAFHIAFTLIVSLMILCICRGAVLYAFEHGFAPKLRAFLDGHPVSAQFGPAATAGGSVGATATLAANAESSKIPQPVPVTLAE